MPTTTAGHLADADQIRSYDDIVAAHHALCLTADNGGHRHADAATRVNHLGVLYRKATVITDEIRAAAETALAAVHQALRNPPERPAVRDRFDIADAWLDGLDLLVHAPTDGR
jgi:hypothetical protein